MSNIPHYLGATNDASESNDPDVLREALATQKEANLRLAADFDNFRKRTRRDSEQQAGALRDSFILELLPILDNLERALAYGRNASPEQLHQGVRMTLREASQLLQRQGMESVDDLGRTFDPHRHEAVSLGHDPRQPDQAILAVIQRGYYRGDKMLRPAKVIVNELSHSAGAGRGY